MALQYRDFTVRQRQVRPARALPDQLPERTREDLERAEGLLAQAFQGVTSNGTVVPGLFCIEETGIPTAGIKIAAEAVLDSLSPVQRAAATFPVDSDEWRRWSNIHPFLMRHGTLLEDMNPNQRDRALGLVKECLSPAGFELARNIMKLNESIREITGSDEELGEWLYWLSVMGQPSPEQPWGWQIDGHHLIINCFNLGDQLVMTPLFMGSEPVAVDIGKYAGTRVFQAEERTGLDLAQALSPEQRRKAIISPELPPELFTAAFRDNFELKYEGIAWGDLAPRQQAILLDLISVYVNRIRSDHARVKFEEVKQHLQETYFAWMGGTEEDSVFYYRVHSPVILIEFDHQGGIALETDGPSRNHIHTVVRTPNGNDYGKDLLRQHHQRYHHSHR
jgi:hypothetical protein